MRLSILAKIIDMLSPRYCPVCGNRLNGEEESICVSCNLFLPRTDTWKDPYNNEMAKMFWHRIPIEKPDAKFCLGVQWHPEWLSAADPAMQGLFDAFVAACRH